MPLDRTLSDTTPTSTLSIPLPCQRVSRFPSHISPSHVHHRLSFPVRLSTVKLSLSAGFRARNARSRVCTGPKWIDLSICSRPRLRDYGATGGHASARCFACELVLLVCCALIRQECGGGRASAREHHLDAPLRHFALSAAARSTLHAALRFSRERDSMTSEFHSIRNRMRSKFAHVIKLSLCLSRRRTVFLSTRIILAK